MFRQWFMTFFGEYRGEAEPIMAHATASMATDTAAFTKVRS